jgi:hypothetical protein
VTRARELELAAEARANVARVIAWMEQPSVATLERSAAELATAASRIELIRAERPLGGLALKSTLRLLRKDLDRATLLMRRAWEFRACLGGQAGYTPAGELIPQIVFTSRWSLEG